MWNPGEWICVGASCFWSYSPGLASGIKILVKRLPYTRNPELMADFDKGSFAVHQLIFHYMPFSHDWLRYWKVLDWLWVHIFKYSLFLCSMVKVYRTGESYFEFKDSIYGLSCLCSFILVVFAAQIINKLKKLNCSLCTHKIDSSRSELFNLKHEFQAWNLQANAAWMKHHLSLCRITLSQEIIQWCVGFVQKRKSLVK